MYSKGGMTLNRIYYGGTTVYFSYAENTKNPQRRYIGDFELVNDKLLIEIEIRQGRTNFRKYVFDYEDKGTVRRLSTISLYAWKPEKSNDDDDSSLPIYQGDDDDYIGIVQEIPHRRITFEYALVSGVNDDRKSLSTLVEKLSGMLCHVNLIPINTVIEKDFKMIGGWLRLRDGLLDLDG